MLAVLVLLLALSACDVRAQDPACDACENAECTVLEAIKVDSLCANELCVDGDPLVGGDNNVCTREELVDGVRVSVRIENCCKVGTNDCDDFRPSSCHVSECAVESEGDAYGICKHSLVHGCCACDQECPDRPCHTKKCVAVDEPPLPLLKVQDDASSRLSPIAPSVSLSETASGKTCEYTPIDDCCIRSTGTVDTPDDGLSCDDKCGVDQSGFCDNARECQCFEVPQFECITDEDCRVPLEEEDDEDDEEEDDGAVTVESLFSRGSPKQKKQKKGGKRKGGKKRKHPHHSKGGPCIVPVCSDSKICVQAYDDEFDGDNDGIPCSLDCDDTDPAKGEFTFCAEGGEEFDADDDGFPKCGAPVERFCLSNSDSCPTEDGEGDPIVPPLIKVSGDDVVKSVHGKEKDEVLVLRYNCDCCDDFPGLDQHAKCGLDNDDDRLPECGTVEEACVPQAPNATAPPPPRDYDDWRKSPKSKKNNDKPPFDQEAADAACQAWAEENDKDNAEQFIAVGDDDEEECDECDNNPELILGETTCYYNGDGDNAGHCPGAESFDECCAVILDSETVNQPKRLVDCCTLSAAEGADCGVPGDDEDLAASMTPILVDQCFCPENFDPIEDLIPIVDECGEDPDGHYYHKCYADLDNDCHADCEHAHHICSKLEDGDDACAKVGKIYLGDEEIDAETDARCDCDDKDEWVFHLVACLLNEDGDEFPSAQCTLVCAADGECPSGYLPLPEEAPEVRKRTTDGVAALFKRNVNKGGRRKGKGGWRKDKCEDAEFPEHQVCPSQEDIDLLLGPNVDCCDIDANAYPASPFVYPVGTNCAPDSDYDFNCDGVVTPFMGCNTVEPAQDQYGRYVREAGAELIFEFQADKLGRCKNDGTVFAGFLPDQQAVRKRANNVDVAAPYGCTTDLLVSVVVDPNDNAIILQAPGTGECGTGVVACVEFGANDKPHEDCGMCLAMAQ